MQDIAAYLTFVLATLALIFSVVVAASLSIAIYEATKWMGHAYAHVLTHRQHPSLPFR